MKSGKRVCAVLGVILLGAVPVLADDGGDDARRALLHERQMYALIEEKMEADAPNTNLYGTFDLS